MRGTIEQARQEAVGQAADRKASSLYRGDLFSLASEDSFHNVIGLLVFTRRPEVSLAGDGIFHIVWRDGTGRALSLHLPGAEDPEYAVFGPGQKFGLPDILARGTCPVHELPALVSRYGLGSLLGAEEVLAGSGE